MMIPDILVNIGVKVFGTLYAHLRIEIPQQWGINTGTKNIGVGAQYLTVHYLCTVEGETILAP